MNFEEKDGILIVYPKNSKIASIAIFDNKMVFNTIAGECGLTHKQLFYKDFLVIHKALSKIFGRR